MGQTIQQRIADIRRGNIPAGYQKTKLGIIPADWSTPELNSVLTENKERNRFGRFGKEDVLSVSGEFGVTNQIELLGRSFAGVSVKDYHVVESGNIVYTKSPLKDNPYGIIKLNKGNAGIVSTLYAVYNCVNPETGIYLDYYFSLDQNVNNYLRPLVRKGTKNDMKINNEDVLKGCIILPSDAEISKIAEIFGCCDRVIALKKELIAEKKKQKKALMQKLLNPDSGFRLPGFSGEWKMVVLENICSFVGGGTPNTKIEDFWHGTIPWISSADVEEKSFVTNISRFITQTAVDSSATQLCPKGSLLIVSRVGVGKIAIAQEPLCTSQDFTNLTKIDGNVVFYAYLLKMILEERARQAQGTSIKGITVAEIKKLCFRVPSIFDEQQAIADIFSASDKEIDLLEQELTQQEQKKKSLMQLLLTGIVRV